MNHNGQRNSTSKHMSRRIIGWSIVVTYEDETTGDITDDNITCVPNDLAQQIDDFLWEEIEHDEDTSDGNDDRAVDRN